MTDSFARKAARMRAGGTPRLLDLFAGCGGLSLGFHAVGFDVRAAVEFDPDAAKSHGINFHRGAAEQVLGKGRMVRDLVIQTDAAKPAIGEIEMTLLAQSALRAYAHAIAGDQHADHQLRIDRGATGAAVERLQRLTNVIEVEMPIDASQHVIGRDMVVEAEIIE